MLNNGTTQDLDPLMWKPPLPSPERSELRDQDEDSMSSPGVEAESGISSMAVSPDLQDAGHDFGETVEDLVVPQSEEVTEAKNNLYTDDAAVSAMKDNTAGLVFGAVPVTSVPATPQRAQRTRPSTRRVQPTRTRLATRSKTVTTEQWSSWWCTSQQM